MIDTPLESSRRAASKYAGFFRSTRFPQHPPFPRLGSQLCGSSSATISEGGRWLSGFAHTADAATSAFARRTHAGRPSLSSASLCARHTMPCELRYRVHVRCCVGRCLGDGHAPGHVLGRGLRQAWPQRQGEPRQVLRHPHPRGHARRERHLEARPSKLLTRTLVVDAGEQRPPRGMEAARDQKNLRLAVRADAPRACRCPASSCLASCECGTPRALPRATCTGCATRATRSSTTPTARTA